MATTGALINACVDLLETTSRLADGTQNLFTSIIQAESDLQELLSDLASLRLSVRAIATACCAPESIPTRLRGNLRSVITGCNQTLIDIRDIVSKYPATQPDRASRWITQGRLQITGPLRSFEAHKSAIQIALEMVLTTNTEEQTSQTSPLPYPQSTDQIFLVLREIRMLQFQVAHLARQQTPQNSPLQRFLEDVSEYTESVYYRESDASSLRQRSAIEGDENEATAASEIDSEDFYSVRESFTDELGQPSTPFEDVEHHEASGVAGSVPTEATLPQPQVRQLTFPNNLPFDGTNSILPSSSTHETHSLWSYTSIRLRIFNRLHSVRTASDTTRSILSALSFLDPAVRAVRLARQQGVLPLTDTQKCFIDTQISIAEAAIERASKLVEPARVDLQVRGGLRFVRKVSLVLRDEPRIRNCFVQLSEAGKGLNEAAAILYGTGDETHGYRSVDDGDSASGMSIPAPPYSLT